MAKSLLLGRVQVIVIHAANTRDNRGVTSSLAEQFWAEGQAHIHPEPADRVTVEGDILNTIGKPEALKLLTKSLVLFR